MEGILTQIFEYKDFAFMILFIYILIDERKQQAKQEEKTDVREQKYQETIMELAVAVKGLERIENKLFNKEELEHE